MKIFGLTVQRAKAAAPAVVPVQRSGLFGVIRESFTGAWQKNVTVDNRQQVLAYSSVFACATRIAGDIAKLRIKLTKYEGGIWKEVESNSPFLKVLRKPNPYQNRIQFLMQWHLSKQLRGNAYILKRREALRGLTTEMYVLDPDLVLPLVSPDGSVYYQIGTDTLSGLTEQKTVPASEIIHDRGPTPWHPLVGVSPLFACAASATVGNRIQANSAKFFENMSRPSGMLTSPDSISDETAARMKKAFEENYSGDNIGRLAVGGDGLKYEPMTMAAVDAQLIEQLRWTVEDVARAFGMPLYKINAGPVPAHANLEALSQGYYTECLQLLIEAQELCLDEGLELPTNMGTEADLDGLLRMDTQSLITSIKEAVGAGLMSPDEGRRRLNLPKVKGGDTPYLQEQNWPLSQLASRETPSRPITPPAAIVPPALPAPDQQPTKAAQEEAYAMADVFIEGLTEGVENA